MLNLFTIISQNWPIALLITFCFWPGLMFLVGWIGESRLVPIGENQSKAFFPGDLTFGVMFIMLAVFYTEASKIDPDVVTKLEAPGPIGVSIVLALLVSIPLRKKDKPGYPKRALRSPTKICHDVIGYVLIPFMVIWLVMPAIELWVSSMWFDRKPDLSGIHTPIEIIILMGMIYGFCVWKDTTDTKLAEKAKYMHTAYWQPLWKKTPPQ